MAINFTTPVGRIVQGDLAKPQPVLDNLGKPKLSRDGTPMVQHFIALAIAKTPGHTHWAQTDWGRQALGRRQSRPSDICASPYV